MEDAAKRVEDEAEDFQRDDAEQRFRIPWLAQDDRCMCLAVGEREPALRDGPADGGTVREHKFHLPLRGEADVLPYPVGEQRVGRSAVDEEANARFLASGTADGALDVADTHAPEDGILVRQRRDPKIAGRGKATPGHFRVSVQVGHAAGGPFAPVKALVDTGATYTWIPRDVLERLGVEPEEEWPFVLADGREVRYPIAWVQIKIGERARPTIVVFGEPGSEPILGVFALEGFRLAADPVNRRLISVPGLLKAAPGRPVHGQGRAASSLAIAQILASTVAIIVVATK